MLHSIVEYNFMKEDCRILFFSECPTSSSLKIFHIPLVMEEVTKGGRKEENSNDFNHGDLPLTLSHYYTLCYHRPKSTLPTWTMSIFLQDGGWVLRGQKAKIKQYSVNKFRKIFKSHKIICLSCELQEIIVLGSCHYNKYQIWTIY